MTLMFVTRQTRKLGFVYAIATLFFDVILGSRAVGQTPGGAEAKTLTLGIVSPVNQKEIEPHFRDFVRYVARKLAPQLIEGSVIVAPSKSTLANLLTRQKLYSNRLNPYQS